MMQNKNLSEIFTRLSDETKKMKHKWHWYWFKRHIKWLGKEWKDDIYKELYKAINDATKELEPIAYVTKIDEKTINEMIKELL